MTINITHVCPYTSSTTPRLATTVYFDYIAKTVRTFCPDCETTGARR